MALYALSERDHVWLSEYADPHYWDARTPQWKGMPKLVNFYLNLSDKEIRSFLSKQKGRTLDIGCGDGRFLPYADVGVDFSKGMLKRARKKYPTKNVISASATHMPFRNGVFDLSFMITVLLHIHPSKHFATISEASRVARRFYNLDSVGGKPKVSWFARIFIWLSSQGFKPTILVALMELLLSFPIERISRAWHSYNFEAHI